MRIGDIFTRKQDQGLRGIRIIARIQLSKKELSRLLTNHPKSVQCKVTLSHLDSMNRLRLLHVLDDKRVSK